MPSVPKKAILIIKESSGGRGWGPLLTSPCDWCQYRYIELSIHHTFLSPLLCPIQLSLQGNSLILPQAPLAEGNCQPSPCWFTKSITHYLQQPHGSIHSSPPAWPAANPPAQFSFTKNIQRANPVIVFDGAALAFPGCTSSPCWKCDSARS